MLKQKSHDFLNNELPKQGVWGGSESLGAISEIYRINIVVFNEKGSPILPNDFQPDYNRSVCLAYRLLRGSKTERNHYDSISEVENDVLFYCSKYLSGFMNKTSCDDTWEIEDSVDESEDEK